MNQSYYRPQRNWGARVEAVIRHGLTVLVLENRLLRIEVAVGRGADIVAFNYKPRDMDFVWLSANGIRHPDLRRVPPADPRMAFYDSYPGGWQEVFPVGGAPSSGPGLPFGSHGMHGEVWHQPWDWEIVEDRPQAIEIRLGVRTEVLPYRLTRTMRLEENSPVLEISERAENLGARALPLMWGHHITFGHPFLAPGARLDLPPSTHIVTGDIGRTHRNRRLKPDQVSQWPFATGADGGPVDLSRLPPAGEASDMIYLTGFDTGRFTVRRDGLALSVAWDERVMPHLWFWQEFGASVDYPWFGRHYNIGLEPFTSTPREGLAASVENGTCRWLEAGASLDFSLSARVEEDRQAAA